MPLSKPEAGEPLLQPCVDCRAERTRSSDWSPKRGWKKRNHSCPESGARQLLGRGGINRVQNLAELHGAMPAMAIANDLTADHLQSGKPRWYRGRTLGVRSVEERTTQGGSRGYIEAEANRACRCSWEDPVSRIR